MSLLQMSISGAILILAIVVIRAVTINRLPKKTFLVLWGIVLLRLLIPFSIPSVFSVYSLIGQNTTVNNLGKTPVGNFAPVMQGEPLELTGEVSKVSASHVSPWFVIWLVGMVFCTAFFAISYLRCCFEFSTSLPVRNDFVEKWLKEHRLMRSVSIRQSDRIFAPLTYGIFKPVILVPQTTDWKNTKQLQYVFLHEYVHIRRFDTVTKLICTFALCVHWFNPLVWVMYIFFNRDIELACDESVVRLFGEKSKKDYSLMLISMEAKKSGLLPFCNNFSKNAIEERITAIMKIKKNTILSLAAACVIVLGIITVLATSAHDKTVIGITETAKAYETMSYEEFKSQTGNAAEFYHADRFIGEISESSLFVIYRGKYNEDEAMTVLADDDMPIRLQGSLGVLMEGIKKEMTITELVEALSLDGAAKADFELLEGGGTAYYVGNKYVQIQFDSDKDGKYDRLLLISLDESAGENVDPESIAWLELL